MTIFRSKMYIYAVLLCSGLTLSACHTMPVVKQAEEQAKANHIVAESIDDKLLMYMYLSSGQVCESLS